MNFRRPETSLEVEDWKAHDVCGRHPGTNELRGWGSKPSCLISSPLYRFILCQLKFVYCLKTKIKRVGGGGGGGGREQN